MVAICRSCGIRCRWYPLALAFLILKSGTNLTRHPRRYLVSRLCKKRRYQAARFFRGRKIFFHMGIDVISIKASVGEKVVTSGRDKKPIKAHKSPLFCSALVAVPETDNTEGTTSPLPKVRKSTKKYGFSGLP